MPATDTKAGLRVCAATQELDARPDDELMQLASAGVMRAFELVIRRYEAAVCAFCARRCGSGVGEELAQEVFLALWDARASFQPRGQFRAFLFTIAERRCANAQRTARRATERHERAELERLDPATPLEELLASERQRRLHASVRTLPEEQQRVIYLRYAAGLDYDDIAALMARPAATIRQRVFAGLAKLRRLLPQQEGET